MSADEHKAGGLSPERVARTRRWLRIVRWSAWIDLVLLVVLIAASIAERATLVSIFGWVHGVQFIFLVLLVAAASVVRLWGWWFPAAVLFTGGPLGALAGDWIIARRLKAHERLATAQVAAGE